MRIFLLSYLLVLSTPIFAQEPPSNDYRLGNDVMGIPSDVASPSDDQRRTSIGTYRDGEKFGFANGSSREPAIYDLIKSSYSGFILKKDNKYAIADKKGALISGFDYDSIANFQKIF